MEKYQNKAFISYAQKDAREARRLQHWLEGYRIPKEFLKQNSTVRRLGRVFRDTTHLAGAANLSEALQNEIDRSECLIVICSPHAARSEWVNREIEHFRATGRHDRIFAIIIDGVPNDTVPEQECFPTALRERYSSQDDAPLEPLAVNVRIDGWKKACVRLVAGLIQRPFDQVWQREKRKARRKTLQSISLTMVIMVLGSAALVGTRYLQTKQQFDERARVLLTASGTALDEDNAQRAARFALAAIRFSSDEDNLDAAADILRASGRTGRGTVEYEGAKSKITGLAANTTGTRLAAFSVNGDVIIWNTWTGDIEHRLFGYSAAEALNDTAQLFFTPAGDELVVVQSSGFVEIWGVNSGDRQSRFGLDISTLRTKAGAGTRRVFNGIAGFEGEPARLIVHDLDTGNPVHETEIEGDWVLSLDVDAKAGRALIATTKNQSNTGHRVFLFDLNRSEVLFEFPTVTFPTVSISPDGRWGVIEHGLEQDLWKLDPKPERVAELATTRGVVQTGLFSSNADYYAAIVDSMDVRASVLVWRLDAPGEPRVLANRAGSYSALAFSADSTILYAATDVNRVHAFPIAGDDASSELRGLDLDIGIPTAYFSNDGSRLIASVNRPDGVVADALGVWTIPEGDRQLTWQNAEIELLAVNSDASLIAVAPFLGATYVTVLDAVSGDVLATLELPNGHYVTDATFAASGNRLVVASQSGLMLSWSTENWSDAPSEYTNASATGRMLALNDTNRVFALSETGALIEFTAELSDVRKLLTLPDVDLNTMTIELSREGDEIIIVRVAAEGQAGEFHRVSLEDPRLVPPIEFNDALGLAVSPDLSRLAIIKEGRGVWLLDLETGNLLLELFPRRIVGDEAFNLPSNPDVVAVGPNNQLVAASYPFDEATVLWDANTGQELGRYPFGGSFLQFTPDGERLLIAGISRHGTLVDVSNFLTTETHDPARLTEHMRNRFCNDNNTALASSARRITPQDVIRVPILEDVEGMDVCGPRLSALELILGTSTIRQGSVPRRGE